MVKARDTINPPIAPHFHVPKVQTHIKFHKVAPKATVHVAAVVPQKKTALGTIIAYDPVTDTCTVELSGDGATDTWVVGVKLAANIVRAFAVYGSLATLDVPDANKLCDLTVVGIQLPGSNYAATGTGTPLTLTGQAFIYSDASGDPPSGTITFPHAFQTVPTVYAGGLLAWSITGVSPTQFSATLPAGTYAPNTGFLCSWSATGQSS